MHVFFVRHGETTLNQKHIHQWPTTSLSPKGRDQALSAAEYLRPMNVSKIITSGATRAVETARIIGSVLELTPEGNDLFREIDRPTNLCGTSIFSPKTASYVISSVLKRNDPLWRYADAENFTDIYRRVLDAFAYIESLQRRHASLAIVSHTMFINLMVAYMCHGRMIAVRDLLPAFFNIGTMDNCGIVELVHNGSKARNTCPWEFVVRNGTSV